MNTAPYESKLVPTDSVNVPWEVGYRDYNYQLTDHGGVGLLEFYHSQSHKNFEALEFMYNRVGRDVFPGYFPEEDILEWAYAFAYYAVDQYDPYFFFHGFTDVQKSEESDYYQFSVRDDTSEKFREVSGENVELYKLFPKGAEVNFPILYNDMDRKTGLLRNFDLVYDYFHEHVGEVRQDLNGDWHPDEMKLFQKYGTQAAIDLMEASVWAALLWMISPEPESREWRYTYHPIFQIVYDHKACLLESWVFHTPEYFKMEERPLGSCSKCKTTDWCVELYQTEADTSYLCQSCVSEMRPFPGMTCGTKMCTALGCINHPAHQLHNSLQGDKAVRQIEAVSRYGELTTLENGMHVRQRPGILYVNNLAIEQTTKSIADKMGSAFTLMLEESFD